MKIIRTVNDDLIVAENIVRVYISQISEEHIAITCKCLGDVVVSVCNSKLENKEHVINTLTDFLTGESRVLTYEDLGAID